LDEEGVHAYKERGGAVDQEQLIKSSNATQDDDLRLNTLTVVP
jgi:hypothetical protein